MKIGFDLDGILIPDYSEEGNLNDYLHSRVTHFKPLFDLELIKGELFIITGRPGMDFEDTKKWVYDYFKKVTLLHNNEEQKDAVDFKRRMINLYKIDLFFESNYEQYKYLLESTKAKVIHWESFIVDSITKLLGDLK